MKLKRSLYGAGPDGMHWDGIFYWNANLKRGTFYIFRPDSDQEKQELR
jgi:hypothetical protein